LSPEDTSPYAFYQYWLNCADADVENFLKWYTMLGREEIEAIVVAHREAPHQRAAQRKLAEEVTLMVHGRDALRAVEQASQALFGGDIRALSEDLLAQVFADVPSSDHARESLQGEGVALVDLLPETTLASSKREARQFLEAGAVSLNGERTSLDHRLRVSDLLHGHTILLKHGKKLWHATRWR